MSSKIFRKVYCVGDGWKKGRAGSPLPAAARTECAPYHPRLTPCVLPMIPLPVIPLTSPNSAWKSSFGPAEGENTRFRGLKNKALEIGITYGIIPL